MEGYCCYRLSGHGHFAEAASKIIEVITFSRDQGMRNLLIDTTGWTCHESPDFLERFNVAKTFAEAARSKVRLAMVVRPEMMDPYEFEVTVARNRGLVGNILDSEKDALTWLLDPDCSIRTVSAQPDALRLSVNSSSGSPNAAIEGRAG